jgi:hypothetical protein
MIVTLTPNPSLARTLFLDTFTRGAVNRCTATLVEPSARKSMLRWRCTVTVFRLWRCFRQMVPRESSKSNGSSLQACHTAW